MPRVSVIMPVFNGAAHLADTVETILGQTYRDLELVTVDDGSSDGSLELLRQLARTDGRLRVETMGGNRGHAAASNRALTLATGELIARQDQDDLWSANWIATAVDAFDAGRIDGVGIVAGGYTAFYPDGRVGRDRLPPSTDVGVRLSLLFGNVLCHPAVVLDRSLVRTGELAYVDVDGPQDYDLWTRLLRHTRIRTIRTSVVRYRQVSNSMTERFSDSMAIEVGRISDREIYRLTALSLGSAHLRRVWRGQVAPTTDDVEAIGVIVDALRRGTEPGELPGLDRSAAAWGRRALSALGPRGAMGSPGIVARILRRFPGAVRSDGGQV